MILREIWKKDELKNLSYGLEFPVKEFIDFIGGPSKFKGVIKKLEGMIKDEISRNKKEKGDTPFGTTLEKIVYPDYAIVSWASRTKEVYLRYSIYALDKTGHQFEVAYTVYMKAKKDEFDEMSGWDG